jgi:septation ring formation regulator EzrA|tara:strand:- start:1224 stop:1412 length:189 start_codon:yes stop_codon:yes gene_type:complete
MLDPNKLNEEQQAFVVKYKAIYNKLTSLQEKMDSIRKESEVLMEELKTLRKQENKIFKNGKK